MLIVGPEDDSQVRAKLDKIDPNLAYKTCKVCGPDQLKPPRARHCKFCDRCCLKLDHHCYWIGNCIGLYNTKFFFQYGFYVFLANMVVLPGYFSFLK